MLKYLLIIALVMLSSCASKEDHRYTNPKDDLNRAKAMVADSGYKDADLFLSRFNIKYPYSHYTIEAELLRAYVNYLDEEYDMADLLCTQFIKRHPRYEHIDYAKYLLAMSHYKHADSAIKEQSSTHKAIEAFIHLIDEHPDSPYTKDAKRYLQTLINMLAEHELVVGKYEYDHYHYLAAANRFQVIVKKYQTTPSIEEGLYWLAASYRQLGMEQDSKQIRTLLSYNHPHSSWSHEPLPAKDD